MNVLSERKFDKPSAVIIGKFDGVHKGHRKLISDAAKICREDGLSLLAYTFGGSSLTTEAEKLALLTECCVENIYIQPLDSGFKNTSPEEFIRILKEDLCARCVAVGFNFRFGKDRCADAEDMKKLCKNAGITAHIAPPVTENGELVSSTRIRAEISSGKVAEAAVMLGRPYSVTAQVGSGKHLGRKIGMPTANLRLPPKILLPKTGVYACIADTPFGRYSAVTNIGDNPTVDTDGKIKAEAHIMDFDENLYGEEITLRFLEYVRGEKKFDSLAELQAQVERDKQKTKEIVKDKLGYQAHQSFYSN